MVEDIYQGMMNRIPEDQFTTFKQVLSQINQGIDEAFQTKRGAQKRMTRQTISNQLNTIYTAFKQAFEIKRNPFPWVKALSAGIAFSLPVFVGLLCENMAYGLLACMGAFTYLYVFDLPYVQRAKKIFFVMWGIALSVVLGTLLAPYQLIAAIFMGLIGTISVFIFGALKYTGPSAIFFVLTFAMASGMPVDPSLAPLRGRACFIRWRIVLGNLYVRLVRSSSWAGNKCDKKKCTPNWQDFWMRLERATCKRRGKEWS
ncbi:hypothetical protein RWE15_12315 [Virgibacillus halophilus]|uniref:Fusaric acid resistance protein-like n=1 Tax=Tigheibacillus halophilus TaxID=361280 RepID=A0ABU5C766_9BACI|nr:hypothetical protein [Virgibacillus halophilus]